MLESEHDNRTPEAKAGESTPPFESVAKEAIKYAREGWRVFPCKPATKQPFTPNGHNAATTDVDQIVTWWSKYPNAMIGMPTGAASGVFVVDVDKKPDTNGLAELERLQGIHGALPATLTASTPSGGKHFFFKYVDGIRNRGGFEPGIDVRGEGGYVILPGSAREDGRTYDWESNAPIAAAPDWLLQIIKRQSKTTGLTTSGNHNPSYSDAAINSELQKLIGTSKNRNNQLNDTAMAIGQFVGAGEISRATAERRLLGAAAANGYIEKDGEAAARATIKSGLDAGERQPRDIPESEIDGLPEEEDPQLVERFIARCLERQRAAIEEVLKDQTEHSKRLIVPPACTFDNAPFGLRRPGGLITDIAQFVFETSPSPIPDFSIMSAVALLAGILGRRWLTPDGLGLNLYIALVAGSGFGKDRPLKAMSQLADSIGQEHVIGPNDVASDSALEMILRQSPCQVLPLDELGMLLSASGKSSDSYARARRKAMLELYSSATSSWVAKVRASDFQKGQAPKPKIQWPTLSFLGATTPSTFYEGLEEDAFRSGFIARLIVVAIDTVPERQSIHGYPDVPQPLIDRLLEVTVPLDGPTPAFARAIAQEATTKPQVSTANWANPEALTRLDQIRDWARDVGIEDERRGQIVNRAGDHTSKLATIRAISRSPHNPSVELDDIEWAFGIVMRSIKTVEDGAERFMFGSRFEALVKAILEAVRQCKDDKGLKNAELLRKPGVSHEDEKMVGQALSRLINGTGQLRNVGAERLGPGGRGGRYVLATVH